jgi:hypothetical protein
MTTRRELIIQRYTELTSLLKEHIDGSLFPSLNDVDVTDLIMIFNLYFINDENIDDVVKDLIRLRGVVLDDATIKKVCEIIKPFVVWFHSL